MSLIPYTNIDTPPAPWSPALMFQGGSVGGFWDIQGLSALKQNSDGTGAVTAVGDRVGYVTDKSGNGNPLIQATASARPTLRQDARGRYYLEIAANQGLVSKNSVTAHLPIYMAHAGRIVTTMAMNLYLASNKIFQSTFLSDFRMTSSYAITGQASASRTGALGEATPGVETVHEALFTSGSIVSCVDGGTDLSGAGGLSGAYSEAGYKVLINMNSPTSPSTTASQDFYGGVLMLGQPSSTERTQTTAYLRRACGLNLLDELEYDIFGFGGQSNMQGQGDYLSSTAVPWGQAAEYESGFLRPLKDPTRHYNPPAGSVSNTGSMLPAWASAYYAACGRIPLLCGGGASGIGITTGGWNPTPDYRNALAAKMVAAKQLIEGRGGTATIRGIVFEGGENDAMNAIAKATVKTGVVTLRDNLRAALVAADPSGDYSALPVFMLSIDRNTDSTKDAAFQAVREAISEACAENSGLELVMPYQDFTGQALLVDTIHWNQSALNTAGSLSGTAVADYLWP
jgi:hypothetical protein